jgi:hypothetical protein
MTAINRKVLDINHHNNVTSWAAVSGRHASNCVARPSRSYFALWVQLGRRTWRRRTLL